jgi:hypothetical protein
MLALLVSGKGAELLERTPKEKKVVDWQGVLQQTVSAVTVAAVLGLGTLLWNSASGGGLVRFFGGVTKAELDAAVSKSGNVPTGAVVAFDGPICPPGWNLADQTIGSSIVGAGAWLTGEPGSPLPNDGRPDLTNLRFDPTKGTPPKLPNFVVHDPAGVPVSRYVFGVRTSFSPSYLPLWYCKKT